MVVVECASGKGEINDPEERREASMKESHSTNRAAQRRTRIPFDDPPPPRHPPLNKMTTTISRSATSRTITKEEGIDDLEGWHGRATTKFHSMSHNTQPRSHQPPDDPPSQEHPSPVRTETPRPRRRVLRLGSKAR